MQARLLALIGSPAYAALHNPAYALMANPFAGRYQNCDDFLLRLVAAAGWGLTDAERLDAGLRERFKPTVVRLDPIVRWLGPLFDRRLALDDQHGPILTASEASIAAFMAEDGWLQSETRLTLPALP